MGVFLSNCRAELEELAENGEEYNLFTYITHPGAEGEAGDIGSVCSASAGHRISITKAYGPDECSKYSPPDTIDCSYPLSRITLTAEV